MIWRILGLMLVLATPAAAQEKDKFERIETEEDFVEAVIDKRLIYDTGAVVLFLEDRTLGGDFSGSRIWGEWVWRDEKLCHQFNVGEKRYKVICKIPQLGKRKIRFIREDGTSYGVAKIR